MSSEIAVQSAKRKFSIQMRAVLMVLEADPFLKEAFRPHMDLDFESIYWDRIFKIPFSSGHKTAVLWIYGIWTDEDRPRANVFGGALNLSAKLQAAILNALALRWGLVS